MLFFLVCSLVGLDTIGSVAKDGARGFTWLAALGLFFFVPYAMLTAELGSTFPEEGGPYYWTRLAFGRKAGAIAAIFYWISNPIWLGGSLAITAVTAAGAFFTPLRGASQIVFSLIFIWGAVLASILSFRFGKWFPTIGALARLLVIPLFTFSVGIYVWKNGFHGFSAGDFTPDYASFISMAPVIFFNYTGFELPSSAGDEMTNPRRDVPFAIALSGLLALLLYGVPILAILVTLPRHQVTGLSGFVDAIKLVFSVYGSHTAHGAIQLTGAGKWLGEITCALFILALGSSGASWIMGADRVLATACFDGAGPRALGRFSGRFGTPVTVNLLSGVISTLFMILATTLTSGDANRYFQAALALAISTTTIAYLAVFPSLTRLRRLFPEATRPYQVPGGMPGARLCSSLATGWAIVAVIELVWPGLGVGWFRSRGKPDDLLPAGFTGLRTSYELTQIVPLLALVLVGLLFYGLGRSIREETASM